MSQVLNNAVENEMVVKNVVAVKAAPKPADTEMVIVTDIPAFIATLKTSKRFYHLAMVLLFTGARLGEGLALRWNAIDLDRKTVEIREALEQTRAHGIRFKKPKTRAGRRTVVLPDILVSALREYRRQQLELRMKLGAGKLPDDALLFADLDGTPISPNTISQAWGRFAERIGMGDITVHALRHSHASLLIASGVDIVTISKRLGHAKPDITLRTYAHLFRKDDASAAAAINAVFAG
jgi:integrase